MKVSMTQTFYAKRSKGEIVRQAAAFARKHHSADAGGHDWEHIQRVWKMAERIAKVEHADMFTVQLAALLHDIADWKESGNLHASARVSREFLANQGVDEKTLRHVEQIVTNVSFKGAGIPDAMQSLEGKIVQDADRLDAIGAIAIARTFAWGGSKGRRIYIPGEKHTLHQTFKHYANNRSSSIAHFYEKLLLLKPRLHTKTAKKIAGPRHAFMLDFLDQFFLEWKGK